MMTAQDQARRLYQVRAALVHLHMPADHRVGMEELASNLERKINPPARKPVTKGN